MRFLGSAPVGASCTSVIKCSMRSTVPRGRTSHIGRIARAGVLCEETYCTVPVHVRTVFLPVIPHGT